METKTKIGKKNAKRSVLTVVLFFLLTQAIQVNIALGASISAEEMLDLTNQSRNEEGLPSLVANDKLKEAAVKKMNNMFEFQYFDHNSPSGLTPWDFIRGAGYNYVFAGENLAINFITANGAHKALMASSSHRENILNSNYTEIGIAVGEDIFEGGRSIIIVEEFGRPLEKETSASPDFDQEVEIVLEQKVEEINEESGKSTVEPLSWEESENNLESFGMKNFVKERNSSQKDELRYKLSEGNVIEIFHFIYRGFSSIDDFGEKENNYFGDGKGALASGIWDDKNIRGIMSEIYSRNESIKKYDPGHYENVSGVGGIGYQQHGFFESILVFYAVILLLLVSDSAFLVCLCLRNSEEERLVHCPKL